MKKLLYLLILISGICNAQIVNIPDPIFKSYLLNNSHPTIDLNGDNEIDYSEAESYTSIFLMGNMSINDLTGIEAFIHLRELHCGLNNLTSLNVSGLTDLNTLFCDNNQLTNLNVTGDYNLITIDCYYNQLTTLDVSGLSNLNELFCNNNLLNIINLSGTTNLNDFLCHDNQLTTLDFSQSPNLTFLNCANNQITSLDVSNLIDLQFFGLYNNLISTIDITNCTSIINFVFNQNPLLTNVYMKNGRDEGVNMEGLPNLQFICADESQIVGLLQQYPNLNGLISSYCTFTPGGNYNTITGIIKFDINNNGCDVNDSVQPNIRMNITEPNATGASFTNNSGNYAFFTQSGTFTITPDVENPTWFNFTPNNAEVVFADNNNNVATQDFCVAANGFHPDIEVVISPIIPALPGFNAVYQITYKNKGNYTYTDGFVNLEYDDTVLDFVSTSQSPNSQGLGSIGWIFSNLLPFESRSIQVTFNVNAPTETPAVNIGDVLTFRAYSYPSEVDETPLDNDFSYNQTVVGSYDPNDISCLEGNSLPPSEIGNYLHYAINFENTGNYPAENIVVKTEVDATKFDINSLQLLATSNPVDARITGNKVEFIFQNIQLPIGGHGHILLKVKSKSSLVTGDSVAKRADIFFDYNAPIDTGFANTIFQTLSNTIFETDSTINVYPNPTTSKITINSDFDLKSIQVYDVQGRILETLIGANKILDISNKANGVYFLKITTNKGSKIEKVIKK